jgi:hypothetical protein
MRRQSLVLAMGAALSVGFVQAMASDTIGEIKRIDGVAMVSHGEQFVTAQSGMKLQELDRLMVLEQSEAILEFQDGCRHVVQENEFLTIGSGSTCVNAEQTAESTDYTDVERTATSQVAAPGGIDVGLVGFTISSLAGLTWGLTQDNDIVRIARSPTPISPQ